MYLCDRLRRAPSGSRSRLLELGLRHDAAGVVHVAVPEPAELGAADVERARALELEVDDVVDARVGVGLDAELVGPEGVDDVERGDVEADQPVRGENQLGRLDAAVARVAVGELPLLADHLDVHRRRASGGHERGRGPLPGAGAVLDELVGAEGGEREDDDGRDDRPDDLDRGCCRGRAARRPWRRRQRKWLSAKPMKSSTKSRTGVSTETSTVLSSTCPEAWTLPFPGGICGPRKIATIGVEDDARDEPEDQEAAAVAVPGRGRCGGASVS